MARDAQRELHELCAACYADPLKWVQRAYPWPIDGQAGPDEWQAQALTSIGREVKAQRFNGVDPVMPIRRAWSAGHGVGKTALFAWLVDWLMSTRRNAVGTVTANTNDQLQLKTWAAVRRWTLLCLTAAWFEINSAIMYRKGFRESWFCAPQSCSPENSDAFQGQHVRGSSSFYIFDEGSGIDKRIYDAAEGGLSDGEPMMFVGGNCLRSDGEFHRITHGSGKDLWHAKIIDRRKTRIGNNPTLIAQYVDLYGEDSDFFRVRVRGLPPRASSLNFIDQDTVYTAQQRTDIVVMPDEPLVVGVDFSGGGSAWNVARFRRGADARSIPAIRVKGEATRESRAGFLALLANLLAEKRPERRVAMMFCDAAYGAPYVERLHTLGFKNVQEIRFGDTNTPVTMSGKPIRQATPGEVIDVLPENMRAYMWQRGKEWLRDRAAIDPNDEGLAGQLVSPGFHLNKSDRLVLESKESMMERGCESPDDADALFLTFAAPVLQTWKNPNPPSRRGRFQSRPTRPTGDKRLGWMR